MDDAEYASLTAAKKLSHWNGLQQNHWGKHCLPYIPDMKNKLANSQMLAIVHSMSKYASEFLKHVRKTLCFS